MTTDNTPLNADELKSELRRLLAIHTLSCSMAKRLGLDVPEEVIIDGFIKAIEAYHNKQVGELLDRLESMAAYDPSGSSPVINPREVGAERNKLKEK